jgi:hypothetical protein
LHAAISGQLVIGPSLRFLTRVKSACVTDDLSSLADYPWMKAWAQLELKSVPVKPILQKENTRSYNKTVLTSEARPPIIGPDWKLRERMNKSTFGHSVYAAMLFLLEIDIARISSGVKRKIGLQHASDVTW